MTVILFLSIKSFSQTVILDSITAKKVITELIEYDACKKELIQVNEIILIKDEQLLNTSKIILNKDFQIKNLYKIIDNSEDLYLKHKKQNTLYKVVAITSVLLGVIISVK